MKSRSSPLVGLNPFLDLNNVLRVGGRLALSPDLPYDAKFPRILPKGGEEVEALIRQVHIREGHAGVGHVFGYLRSRWWILKGRSVVHKVIMACVDCQKAFKNPVAQKMAPLPEDRVKMSAPFENTVVDVFGLDGVKHGGRAYQKCWVVLLTCMAIRAVHFEVLKDLSSSTFINALVRFHSQRPGLCQLYSDNGTNFRGADKELKTAVEE